MSGGETLAEAIARHEICRCGDPLGDDAVGLTDDRRLVMIVACRECAVDLRLLPNPDGPVDIPARFTLVLNDVGAG